MFSASIMINTGNLSDSFGRCLRERDVARFALYNVITASTVIRDMVIRVIRIIRIIGVVRVIMLCYAMICYLRVREPVHTYVTAFKPRRDCLLPNSWFCPQGY